MTPIEKAAAYVIGIAEAEVGYLEKATNSQLNDKTANAGSGNYTKFAAYFDDLWNRGIKWYNTRKQGAEWCDMFFDWAQCEAWGYDVARKVIYQPMESAGAGCPYSASYYRANNAWYSVPKPGDQIFFGAKGKETHTGIVVDVTSTQVVTVEGNSGQRVAQRTYALTDGNIAGYGRPNYQLVAYKFAEAVTPDTPIKDDTEDNMTREEIEKLIDQKIDRALGKVIKTIDDLPEWGRREMREVLDCGAIDGGTTADVNPDDINLRLQLIRILIGAKRFTLHEIAGALGGGSNG